MLISRLKVCLIAATLAVIVRSGELSAQPASNTGRTNRIPVYVFRGFVGYSPGFTQWERRLRDRGYEPEVYMSAEWPLVKSRIVQRRQSGDRRPVYVIGYSFGGQAAISLAESLRDERISVESLLMLECYLRLNVPDNVRNCVNVYESRSADDFFIFRGVSVRAASKRTRMTQINLTTDYPRVARQLNHFDITQNVWVQNLIVSRLPVATTTRSHATAALKVASQTPGTSKP